MSGACLKIITIVGARPQFIKAAVVSRAIAKHNQAPGGNQHDIAIQEIIVHTGQHFDHNMSQVFFDQLAIPKPHYNLEIANLNHGAMTGRMLEAIEKIMLDEKPDGVLVYGDTNSTLAGALAAVKLHIPLAHVEAGLRSFNNAMPEEINRMVTDCVADVLFCPTHTAVKHLQREGIDPVRIVNVGDVMYDATLYYADKVKKEFKLAEWKVDEKGYVLCTVHRAENTDNVQRLASILKALSEIAAQTKVILPLHPRTRNIIDAQQLNRFIENLIIIEPLAYLQMMRLEMSATAIITDSGGVQKEAYFHKVPCITVRDETEWVETVDSGWNELCGADTGKIVAAWNQLSKRKVSDAQVYGNGDAGEKIVKNLVSLFNN